MPISPVAALAVTAALAAGPTAALAPTSAPVASAAYSVCRQDTSSYGGGTRQLTPEQAAELLQQARELVTELLRVVGDNRAADLGQEIRSMGITPARAQQMWKQQAYDLADGLTSASSDPRAMQVAVTLAGAGFSPTPADLLYPVPTSSTPRPAAPAAVPDPAQASPNVAAAGTGPTPAGAISRIEPDTATASDGGSGSTVSGASSDTSPGVQVCGAGPGEQAGNTQVSGGAAHAGAPLLTSGPTAAAQTSGPGSSGAAGWERQAGDLVDTLQAANDPEAEQLAGKLAAIGVTGSTPATSPGPVPDTASPAGSPDAVTTDQADGSNGNNVDRGRQADDNTGVSTDATGAGTASSPGQASTAGPGSDRSASADGGNSPDSSANDQQPGDAQQSGWEQQARELADQLARAGDDPTARELTDKLASVGIIADPSPPARNGNSGQSNQTGSRGGDQGSSETGQSGQASDDPGGAGQAGEGDRTAGSQPSGDAGDGGNAGAAEQPPPAQAPAPAGNPAAHPDPGITGADPGADIGTWDRLAGCESGGRWSVSTGNGYSGGLQFDPATWKAFGGDGYAPSADKATKDQQIAVAQKVRDARGGYGSWPACSQKLGLPQ